MTEHQLLELTAPWAEITTTDADWDAADPELLTTMLGHLVLIRAFEEYVLELARDGLIHGPAHSSIGQEGGAVGAVLPLTSEDTLNGSHRGHHQFLAKALAHLHPKGLDPRREPPEALRTLLLRTLAEICGLDRGFGHGRGGSMHLRWTEAGAIGTNAIVGGGVPLAAGSAWAHRHAGTDAVAVTCFGDGAINIGSTLETLNLAAAWRLPLCFFIENNHYAVATNVEEVTGEPRLSARGPGFGIPSWRVDGMDPLAVYLTMRAAVDHMRAGHGPTLIEADVYRYFHQNGPFPGSAFGYRSKAEEQQWRDRDPLRQVSGQLERRGILTAEETAAAVSRAGRLMGELGDTLLEPLPGGRRGRRRIRPAEWPDPAIADRGLRGDLGEFAGARLTDRASFDGTLTEQKFIDAVAGVMARRMETDPTVVVLGEDVHRLNGGTNGATRGLNEAFPDRVLATPISENAFVGTAGGIALDGRMKPVVELMYADFMWVAADQIFNQIGKARHMFGGERPVPLVLRSKVAMGTGYGSQHSMDPAGILATAPGWRIVAPSTPFDYVGLMNSALRCQDPVVVLEHTDLYATVGEGPADDLDYCLPVGRAAVRRTGSGITVLSYLAMTAQVLRAVESLGDVDAEVIDLRWLDRASVDWDTIGASVRKTGTVLIAEQGAAGTSYGGWLADEIHRRFFDRLEQPVRRVTGGEASPSISKVLERAAIAGEEDVAAALTGIVRTATPRTRPARVKGESAAPSLTVRLSARADRLLELCRALDEADRDPAIQVEDLVIKAAARAHLSVTAGPAAPVPGPVDIAVRMATGEGGATPVLRSVDRMTVSELARARADVARRAAGRVLEPGESDGGSLTVCHLGAHGVEEFTLTPVPPRDAALAVGAVRPEPVADEDGTGTGTGTVIANVLRASLSVDGRTFDEGMAAEWTRAFRSLIEAPLTILA